MKLGSLLLTLLVPLWASADTLMCEIVHEGPFPSPPSQLEITVFNGDSASLHVQYRDLEAILVSYSQSEQILTTETILMKHPSAGILVQNAELPPGVLFEWPLIDPSTNHPPVLRCGVNVDPR